MKVHIRKRVFSIIGLIFLAVVAVFLFKGKETYKAVEVNGKTIKAHVKGS